jgi:uncharacterized membrane protein
MLISLVSLLFFASTTFVFQILGLPLILVWLKENKSQAQWWAWGRLVGWLIIGLVIWLTAHLGISVNSTGGFWSVLILSLLTVYKLLPLQAQSLVWQFLRTHRRQIFHQELIFLVGFLFLGLVRTFHPTVLDLEKFMNVGLIQGYLRSPTLPAEDMWLAGESLNYYSFGHFLGSLMLRFWQVPAEIGFNVLLGLMMGLVLVQAFSLSQILLSPFVVVKRHFSWSLLITGLVGALLIVFGGNSHPLWYWLTNHNFTGYWYPSAVRFIAFTIHEIPAYSFIVSDLHAHFWAVPVVLLTIFTVWQWSQTLFSAKLIELKKPAMNKTFLTNNIVLGVLLGVLGMTNTWDMLIYSSLLLVLGGLMALTNKKTWLAIITASWQIAIVTLLIFSPWLLNFSSIVNGVFWVPERSPFWQLVALWSGHVIFSLITLVIGWRLLKKQPRFRPILFILSLVLVGLGCVLLPEIIYFKDIYPTFQRANTMFKFTFQGFMLMSLIIAWLIGWLSTQQKWLKNYWRLSLLASALLFFASTMTYPFLGYPNYYDRFAQSQTLNGLQWLAVGHPAEYQAILWLRNETVGRPVVLEAVGDSYSGFARVSVFSGLSTVIGWRAHEWLWRGGPEIPTQRSREVQWVYEQPLSIEAARILEQYQVKYIFIGSKEREAYRFNIEDVLSLGTVVFQQGNVYILERKQ